MATPDGTMYPMNWKRICACDGEVGGKGEWGVCGGVGMMWRRVKTYLGREERDARLVVRGQLHAQCIVRNHRARPREEVKKEVGDRKPRGEAAARVGAHRRRGRGDVVRGQRAVGNHEFEAGSEGGARGVARAAQALELAARHGGGVRREDAPGEGEGHHQEEHRDDA